MSNQVGDNTPSRWALTSSYIRKHGHRITTEHAVTTHPGPPKSSRYILKPSSAHRNAQYHEAIGYAPCPRIVQQHEPRLAPIFNSRLAALIPRPKAHDRDNHRSKTTHAPPARVGAMECYVRQRCGFEDPRVGSCPRIGYNCDSNFPPRGPQPDPWGCLYRGSPRGYGS